MKELIELVDKHLDEYISVIYPEDIFKAMKYTLSLPGKRLRPVMCLETARILGAEFEKAMPCACAIEMLHVQSLIHDDLPCMDNDFLRRGKPANHIANGEAMALLAGDALLTKAFEVILCNDTVKTVGAEVVVKSSNILARSIGVSGMIGGQVIDLESEGKNLNQLVLDEMHSLKTGALIIAAAKIGCVIAQANDDQILFAENYARCIGLAYQIMDDILDVVSSSEYLGKNVGSDLAAKKSTYVSCIGEEKAKRTIIKLTENAVKSLEPFGRKKEFLKSLAYSLSKRKR